MSRSSTTSIRTTCSARSCSPRLTFTNWNGGVPYLPQHTGHPPFPHLSRTELPEADPHATQVKTYLLRVARPAAPHRNSATPRFALESAALFAFFLSAEKTRGRPGRERAPGSTVSRAREIKQSSPGKTPRRFVGSGKFCFLLRSPIRAMFSSLNFCFFLRFCRDFIWFQVRD